MSAFSNKGKAPDTRNITEGSSKRDIVRKNSSVDPKSNIGSSAVGNRKANASGQIIDDGSTYQDAPSLNENDPNYDSEVNIIFSNYFYTYI